MTTQLLLGLSLLVFVHEFGHFITAKMFGMRVNKFYIFFDAWGKKLWHKKIGETEYGIGWLPLGGYVQIAGMIDETQDAKSMSKEPEEWEFRSKPAWQRFIVMIGGIVMNVIIGVLIFNMHLNVFDDTYVTVDEMNKNGGIYTLPLGEDMGLQTGDKIVAVDGNSIERVKDIRMIPILHNEITIERNGRKQTVIIPDSVQQRAAKEDFVMPRYQQVSIESFPPSGKKSSARDAGVKVGDVLTAIDGRSFDNFFTFKELLKSKKDTTVRLSLLREGQKMNLEVQTDTAGLIGFFPSFDFKAKYASVPYSWGSGFYYGSVDGWNLIRLQIAGFKMMFQGKVKARESVASPIKIAQLYGGTWEWNRFWKWTGILSFVLAFMNALPIPALDGGHMVFLTIEMITGRKLSDDFLEKAQIFGFMLLMGIMVFAFGNDILQYFGI
ncbi:MAG: RIP metalloprotease RseP [Chitinophagales bacterium]